jgi:hypothetical protein
VKKGGLPSTFGRFGIRHSELAGFHPVFAWLDPRTRISGDGVIRSVVLAQTKNERAHAFFSAFTLIATSLLLWRGGTSIEWRRRH